METTNIAELIERVAAGDPWHGPSVKEVLRGVTAETASRRSSANTHSIWELVLHMTGWAREVTARIGGRAAQEPEAGDWPFDSPVVRHGANHGFAHGRPAVGETSAIRWQQAQAALFDAHRDLADAVRQLPAETLSRPVLDLRDNPLGTGLSHYLTLHGIVHHSVYHAGQIALLKRALE